MNDDSSARQGGAPQDPYRLQRIVTQIAVGLNLVSMLFQGGLWMQSGDIWQLAVAICSCVSMSAFLLGLWLLEYGNAARSIHVTMAGGILSVAMATVTNPADIALAILISSLSVMLLAPPTLFAGQKMTKAWFGTLVVVFYASLGARIQFRGADFNDTNETLWVALIAPVVCLLIQWLLTRRLLGQLEEALGESEELRADLVIQNRELAVSHRELEVSQRQAEQANRAKSVFLANMSHELRTPLNAVIGYSEMLAEDAEDVGEEQMLSDARKIESAGRQLLSLIDDVLDMTKIEEGQVSVHAESFEISAFLTELEVLAAPLVAKRHNTFRVECEGVPELVNTDRTKLFQIMSNLISNAAKFTGDGQISLRVCASTVDGAPAVDFVLEDTGVGMDEETQARVFEAFVQADESSTRVYGGSGLGLHLVTQLTELIGGRLEVTSTLGEGSTFTLTIPIEMGGVVEDS